MSSVLDLSSLERAARHLCAEKQRPGGGVKLAVGFNTTSGQAFQNKSGRFALGRLILPVVF